MREIAFGGTAFLGGSVCVDCMQYLGFSDIAGGIVALLASVATRAYFEIRREQKRVDDEKQ